jgi:hypothetical protein
MRHLKKFEQLKNEGFSPFGGSETSLDNTELRVELYYENWMKSYDIVNDYKGMGKGTLFSGDSGSIDEYEELIDRLKDDMENFFTRNDIKVDVNEIEFVNTGEYLETFIKGYEVSFD